MIPGSRDLLTLHDFWGKVTKLIKFLLIILVVKKPRMRSEHLPIFPSTRWSLPWTTASSIGANDKKKRVHSRCHRCRILSLGWTSGWRPQTLEPVRTHIYIAIFLRAIVTSTLVWVETGDFSLLLVDGTHMHPPFLNSELKASQFGWVIQIPSSKKPEVL